MNELCQRAEQLLKELPQVKEQALSDLGAAESEFGPFPNFAQDYAARGAFVDKVEELLREFILACKVEV